MLDKTVKRLEGFGYKLKAGDKAVLKFAVEKVTNTIKNECNVSMVPDGLMIQVGDTNTVFAVGEGSLTPEQRFDLLVEHLLNYGRREFSCYRKIRW